MNAPLWKEFSLQASRGLNRFRELSLLLILTFSITSLGISQVSQKELARKADAFFEEGQYEQALSRYEQLQDRAKQDHHIQLRIGQSAYHTGDYDKAVEYLQRALDADSDIEPEGLRYLGMAWHKNLEFEAAIRAYKTFLTRINEEHSYRENVLLNIKYCASGITLKSRDKSGYIENMGSVINSPYDDWTPEFSPTKEHRIYFTSARSDAQDGDGSSPSGDIYMAEQKDGTWQEARPLGGLVNGSKWERLECFSRNGSQMYFFRGKENDFGEILIDTFEKTPTSYTDFPSLPAIVRPELGDRGLYFFDEETFLFASNRPGGFGGFDLYICYKRDGQWSAPTNLGPTINTPYDEQDPWLAADGRTLYFASNQPSSVGGYDIFRANFDDRTSSWTSVENMGRSINSASDDRHLHLSEDGYSAMISSNRQGGFGGMDLYIIYFQQRRNEQAIVSYPRHFGLVTDTVTSEISRKSSFTMEMPDTPTISVRPLYYEEDELMSQGNRDQLDRMYQTLLDYPEMSLGIEVHSNFDGPTYLDLYFSAKRAEEVAAFFIEKGIDKTRLYVWSVGNQYPMTVLRGGAEARGGYYNRRIEFYPFFGSQNAMEVAYRREQPDPPQLSKTFNQYRKELNRVSFRVLVAVRSGMYEHSLLEEFSDFSVEIDLRTGKNQYRYLVGLLNEYGEAEKLVETLDEWGIEDPEIIPYLNGRKLDQSEVRNRSDQYPELRLYLSEQ